MSQDNGEKIVKYKRPFSLNLGILIFGVIFIYIIFILYSYATSKHIAGYEVKEGSLAVNNTYRGIAIRAESVVSANDSGYINYYAREGERVAHGSMVYTIDESGKLNDIIKSDYETNDALTNEDMNELKSQIINFRNSFSNKRYDCVYDFKFTVEGTVNKLANQNVLTSLSQISDQSILDLVDFSYSPDSGIIVYSYDGMEGLTPANMNATYFDEELHPKTQLQSNALIESGDVAYKLITEDNWSICIQIDEDRYNSLEEGDYVKVKFLKTGDESWGKVGLFQNAEGDFYCLLTFTNSMITFATDRFLDVELELTPHKGLKIPNSSIVEKEFYLIPHSYLMTTNDEEQGFMRETYLEDGKISTEFVPAQIYYSTDDDYYVDSNTFRLGDYIIPDSSGDKFAVGKKATLIGVYNMNKGYADFTQITILYQNKEYAIVKSNTEYGLSVYDHIVLDGASVNDDDFVFE